MAAHLRETLLSLPDSQWPPEHYLALIERLDDEGLDDFTRVRELLGLATGKDNGWHTLRVGELKAMLALAGGDLAQALLWTEWTRDFNLSVFSPQRENYYRCLHGLLLLAQDTEREPAQYHAAFERMYGAEALKNAAAALLGKHCFAGLFTIDGDLLALPAHRALLAAYEKLQSAKRRHWQ
jgi:ribosomal protein S12 methylthiotransferase accessory factor